MRGSCSGLNADVSKWKFVLFNRSTNGLAKSFATTCGLDGYFVEASSLLPKPELADPNLARHVFTGLTHAGQFEIVNQTGTAGCQTGDESFLDQINQMP